jgi:hypothetical protein
MKILFIVKQHQRLAGSGNSWGLLNSSRLVASALNRAGHLAVVREVVDNNSIDGVLARERPDACVIEALWVVPEKMPVLMRLHPAVEFVVRVHSRLAFLAEEGSALDWLARYDAGITVAANDAETAAELSRVLSRKVAYLPNVYPLDDASPKRGRKNRPSILNVGCFGAIRPLKNQLAQAVAAIIYADENDKTLRFHVNAARVEQRGAEVLKNLRALFNASPRHALVEHDWHSHDDFLDVLANVDVSMQVSYTETFNIVTADAVSVGTPVVASPAIEWMPATFCADPNSVEDMTVRLRMALSLGRFGAWLNRRALRAYDHHALRAWLSFAG